MTKATRPRAILSQGIDAGSFLPELRTAATAAASVLAIQAPNRATLLAVQPRDCRSRAKSMKGMRIMVMQATITKAMKITSTARWEEERLQVKSVEMVVIS
jgi:hypothetical protein